MCGITGFTRYATGFGDLAALEQMGQAIFHRGPDAGGSLFEDKVALGHRRLSILDLSAAGTQPMHSENQRYSIVFNGEIYNFLELKAELQALGYQFHTGTDTEVILVGYQEFGTDVVAKLAGMFAFALWDHQEQNLFLARDRVGKKPLYYYHDGQDIAFASELKSLLVLSRVPREIRPDAVWDFFAYQYVPDSKSIFKSIEKLQPGCWMKVDAQGLQQQRYWDLKMEPQQQAELPQAAQELQSLVEQAAKRRMISDVPLGAFLSGGIDSSGVVALMAKNSEQPITTCSIGFDEKKFNETEFAEVVAKQYQTDHHLLSVHDNVKDNLEHIVSFFDEPFADPSLVPTYFVSKLARDQVTVALAGDGGDEIFAGYQKYSTDDVENRLRNKFPNWLRQQVFPGLAELTGALPGTLCKKATTLLTSLSVSPAMGFYQSNAQITDQQWNDLVKPEFSQQLSASYHPSELTLQAYAQSGSDDHLSSILYADIKTYLVGGILVKVDRMSMANSLEVRAPLLDHSIIEYAAKLPANYKFSDKGVKKHILKEAFEPLLPADILHRKKMGFSVPLASWLRGELKDIAEQHLLQQQQGLVDFFKPEQVARLWQQHQAEKADHSALLWSMLMFQMWWNRYLAEPAA